LNGQAPQRVGADKGDEVTAMQGRAFILGLVGAVALAIGPPREAHAELPIIGEGKDTRLDSSKFPEEMKARYALMEVKCQKCHKVYRPIWAIRDGVTPVTGATFDRRTAKRYPIKMMRKRGSEVTRADAKEIIKLLLWLMDVKEGKVTL
jgi:hypothetical protein